MKSHFRLFFFVALAPKGQASDTTMVFYDSVTGRLVEAGWGGYMSMMKENTPMMM